MRGAPPSHRPGEIDQAFALLLPLIGAVTQTTGAPLWRSDAALLSIVQDQPSLVGGLSHLFSRLLLFVPLGSHHFRFALAGALFSALGAWATLHLCHALFRTQGGLCRLDRFLSVGAAVTVGLGMPWLSEATVVGGATLGAALSILALTRLLRDGCPRSNVEALEWGLLGGGILVESPWSALALLGTALLSSSLLGNPMNARGGPTGANDTPFPVMKSLAISLCVAASFAVPVLLENPHKLVETSASAPEWPLFGLLSWIESVGLLWCAGALIAVVFALSDRRPMYALGFVFVLDCIAPGNASVGWHASTSVDPNRMALHLFTIAIVSSLGALGMRTVAESAYALRLFAARPLATMVGVLALAGCVAGAEDSLRTLRQTNTSGAVSWSDEAWDGLPQRALVLTKSDAWSRRLLADQAQGVRPDVLVVPLDQLMTPSSISTWLAIEPELELLLRDLSVSETPSEHAIAHLIEVRPVFLEPNPAWDRRLLEHVLPSVPLAEFSPHAVGRSDRIGRLEEGFSVVDARIREGAQKQLLADQATLSLYEDGLSSLVTTFEKIHDGSTKEKLLSYLPNADPEEATGRFELSPLAQRND